MSKSMSKDCSSTCVPTTIRPSRSASVPRFPSLAVMRASRSILSAAVKRECARITSLSGSLSMTARAVCCARFTVLTMTPAQPPRARAAPSSSIHSSPPLRMMRTVRLFPSTLTARWRTSFPSVHVRSGYASLCRHSSSAALSCFLRFLFIYASTNSARRFDGRVAESRTTGIW